MQSDKDHWGALFNVDGMMEMPAARRQRGSNEQDHCWNPGNMLTPQRKQEPVVVAPIAANARVVPKRLHQARERS
jgi:hypothetical protein